MSAPSKAIDGARVGLSKLTERSRPEGECLVWTGARTAAGYGEMTIGGRVYLVHRLAYTAQVGEIPPDLTIDHLCRNRACVNTAHMEVVTRSENGRRGATKTHCVNGHDLALHARPALGGRRECHPCKRARNARRTPEYIRAHRRKAAAA